MRIVPVLAELPLFSTPASDAPLLQSCEILKKKILFYQRLKQHILLLSRWHFPADSMLRLSYPPPSHQADNFYWQLNNRLHFSVKGLIWKCFYSTNFNLHLNFLQFIWNFKNATLMSWKLFRVKWCDIKLTWFHPQKNQYSECW